MNYVAWIGGVLLALGLVRPAAAQQPVPTAAPDTISETRADSLRRRFDEEKLLNQLKAYTKRKTIAGKAAAALFNFTERREEKAGLDAELLNRQYDRHNYKIVRRINIRTLDAFGYRINDPSRVPRNLLEKGGNALHIKTSRARVRQVLLFRRGGELEPQALSESERLLRQTAELLDARVFVNEQTSSRDSVDIEVVTKDVFSLSGSVQLRDVAAGVIGLRDVNFLGQGHQFRNRYEYGRSTDGLEGAQPWRYEGSYLVPFRYFLNAQANYLNETRRRQGGLRITRDFYSITTKYAGALSYDYFDLLPSVSGLGTPEDPYVFKPVTYHVQDMWLGRSLRLKSYDLGYENPGRLIVSGRSIRTAYTRSYDPIQRDNVLLLGTVGYSVRRYYKDTYLFGFGRTEDIPTGTLASLTAGYEFNGVDNRRYYGLQLAGAGYHPRRGYLYMRGEVSSFIQGRQNDWQQGLISSEILYFTRLYHTGNFQWRHFLWNRSIIGVNRRLDERPLSIEGERGLRGFTSDGNLRGTSRFVVNYETTVYTPFSFLGFRVAAVGFLDAAWLNTKPGRALPFSEAPYTGIGIGLRFRNEYTVLRTFQLLLGFYPRGQYTNNGLRIFENARPYYDFSGFTFGQPGITRYE
ncbi:hypothetical protein LRS06_05265 [Hymenobacter sp. J193]|uniref:hypothetical protein n=1 Tax=Hymenobacter sp. J193 TaxID=2898429 RepID=UPI00215161DD|nr:hypothetical protein [Hymenobacter sp. J193]MCR5887197.1 hypothetical protein [Hymenobacter sp. J193]